MRQRAVIAVPIAQRSMERVIASCSEAEKVADWIEFRLDHLDALSPQSVARAVPWLIHSARKPMIFTYRPITEGGRAPADLSHRVSIWRAIFSIARELGDRAEVFYDLELDLVAHLIEQSTPCPWSQVIASAHVFGSLPDDVETIYRRAAATPARILKIAVEVKDVHEVAALFRLLRRARRERRQAIVLAMGMPGMTTRLLGPAYGSILTFGSLSSDMQTAPGQPPARHLRDIYRVNELKRTTAVYGVVGKPIGHSLSPLIQNVWMRQAGADAVYIPFEVSDLRTFIGEIVRPATRQVPWRVKGFSVTLPHKVTIVDYLDMIEPLALRVGAVNTVLVHRGKLRGFNTDVAGLLRPLLSRMDLTGARVVIVGTGGAARAAAVGLADKGARLIIAGRHREHALALAEKVNASVCSLEELSNIRAELLIHATPVGMAGYQANPIIPTEVLEKIRLVYDLVYNPVETDLVRRARQVGCETVTGVEMFLHQGAEQFSLWFDQSPSIELARAIIEAELRPAI